MIPLDKQSNLRPVNSVKGLHVGHTSTLEPTAVVRKSDLEPLMDMTREISYMKQQI